MTEPLDLTLERMRRIDRKLDTLQLKVDHLEARLLAMENDIAASVAHRVRQEADMSDMRADISRIFRRLELTDAKR